MRKSSFLKHNPISKSYLPANYSHFQNILVIAFVILFPAYGYKASHFIPKIPFWNFFIYN